LRIPKLINGFIREFISPWRLASLMLLLSPVMTSTLFVNWLI